VAGNFIFHRNAIFPWEIVDGQVGGQLAGNFFSGVASHMAGNSVFSS